MYTFSFFRRPVRNVTPCRVMSVTDALKYVSSTYARNTTEVLREERPEARRLLKSQNFDFCTPAVICDRRTTDGIVAISGLMVIDIDHCPNVRDALSKLITSPDVLFSFVSPSGEGAKMFVRWHDPAPITCPSMLDIIQDKYKRHFESLKRDLDIILADYGTEVDRSGSDLIRCCYLCYDPFAYINPILL